MINSPVLLEADKSRIIRIGGKAERGCSYMVTLRGANRLGVTSKDAYTVWKDQKELKDFAEIVSNDPTFRDAMIYVVIIPRKTPAILQIGDTEA